MFALDLFNTKYEKELREGAVDNLEARRIDILNDRMDDLIHRASVPNNKEAREALMHEYNKVKAERDSYYKVNTLKTQDECMGYGTLGEEGIGQDVVNKTEKMARATPPTPAGKVASTVKNAAKWLAGRGGPGQEGPTYEGKDDAWQTETPWTKTPKAKSGRPVDPRGEVTHLSDIARREAVLKAHAQKKNSKEVTESQQLHQGDPVVVTAPNEFEGATGEIYEFSPSGKFVIVDLYNHGKHSMHLSDVKYNDYADQEEDDWYDEEVDEGFQDFNKVEPYEVCLAGKPVKQFDYYEDARRFHDNWKKKLYREGNTEKADKITLNPIMKEDDLATPPVDTSVPAIIAPSPAEKYMVKKPQAPQAKVNPYDDDESTLKVYKPEQYREAANPAQQAAIAIAMKKAGKKPKQVDELDANTLKSYADKRGAQVAAMKADNPNPNAGSEEWIQQAVPGQKVARAGQKIARKERQQGVAEGVDQVKKVFKDKSGKPVGEIGIDPESSPGNGEWYVYHYATGYSVVGFDSAAEAKRELMYVHKHPDAVEGHPSTTEQGVAEGEGGLGQVAGIGFNGKQFNFSIKDLIAKAQNYPIKKLNPQLFVKQLADRHEDPKQTAARAQAADLQYPIIVVQDGNTLMIADGTHRAQKAIMNKLPSINAYVIPVEDMAEFSKQGVAEGQTDYQKRRQREKDVDAGRPVKALPKNPQTDYARKRAKERRDLEQFGEDDVDDFVKAGGKITYGKPQKGPRRPGLSLASRHIGGGGDKMKSSRTGRAGAAVGGKPVGIKEEQDTSGVEQAILRRIMVSHTDLLKQFGPEKVMQAAEEVAYNVGDVDEIGTSDVSAYVNQVKQILGAE